MTFPRTVAPANDSDLTEQEGKCTDVNSVNKVKLVSVCLSNGEWNNTDDLMCLCNPGYELVNGSVAALECKGLVWLISVIVLVRAIFNFFGFGFTLV